MDDDLALILFLFACVLAYISRRYKKKRGKWVDPKEEPSYIANVNNIGGAVQAIDQHGQILWQRSGRLHSYTQTHVSVICKYTGYTYNIKGDIAFQFAVDDKDIIRDEN